MTARLSTCACVAAALLFAGCATPPPPAGTIVSPDRFAQLVVPGRTTRAELLAAFGPTKSIAFDSGMEAWLYEEDAGAGRRTELVLLLGPDGVVRKLRRRPPYPTDPPPR